MQRRAAKYFCCFLLLSVAAHISLHAQQQKKRTERWKYQPEIRLHNPSLESPNKNFVIPPAWKPHLIFLGSKEIRDLRLTRFYSEEHPSQDGANHIALAAYADGVRENIGQRLRYPIIPGFTFTLEVWLCYSPKHTQVHPIQSLFDPKSDFMPLKLQVYGFTSDSDLGNALLTETPVIDHEEWRKYILTWESSGRYDYLYFVPSWESTDFYDGNLHMDNFSLLKATRVRRKLID
jgi:hypothetical protein